MLLMMMDLFIETLTGTIFELRVSPYETILSLKNKIQRVEGIPILQQHLIWQNRELDNDVCLRDSFIPPGSTLRLVLDLRGGPINTRRLPLGFPTSPVFPGMRSGSTTPRSPPFAASSSQGGLLDESPSETPVPPSSHTARHPVTLLVFREGDQLNFFRVVDRGDGSITPFAESMSTTSPNDSCYVAEDDEDDLNDSDCCDGEASADKLERCATSSDNQKMRERLSLLQSKMDQLKVNKRGCRLAPIPSQSSDTTPAGSEETTHGGSSARKVRSRLTPRETSSPRQLTAKFSERHSITTPNRHIFGDPQTTHLLPSLSLLRRSTLPAMDTSHCGQFLPPLMFPSAPGHVNPSSSCCTASLSKPAFTKRCLQCNKKTGLASSYLCRCGNNYCAQHRYAEVHHCIHDYKSEGRRYIEDSNPVIAAPKLPKI